MTPRPMLRTARRVRAACTTLHVALLFSAVEAGLRLSPLPRLSRMLGTPLSVAPERTSHGAALPMLTLVERRRLRAVRRVSGRLYRNERGCLREALVAGRVLRRHGPTLRVGVRGDDAGIRAHAWLEIEGARLEPDRGYVSLVGSD